MSAIKIKPFPKPQPSTSLPQSLYLNESSLQCSFENEFGGNANNIDWSSSFIIADTNAVELDDHQSSSIQVSSPTCDNMALLNASEDPLIKSACYNKTRSKLPEMSDKGI